MTQDPLSGAHQFLTVAEAARKLGQSRLRVREAVARGVLQGRQDNEGRLRVDLPEGLRLSDDGTALDPDAVLSLLFDEVEDLEATVAERDRQLAALQALAERQDAALEAADRALSLAQAQGRQHETRAARADTALAEAEDRQSRLMVLVQRADAALETSDGNQTRLLELLERALRQLEDSPADVARLSAVSDRALDHLDKTGADLATSLSQNARFERLLARALDLAQAGEGGHSAALGQAADRAFALLDDAMARAEAGQRVSERTGDMLDRALQAGERMQAQITEKDNKLEGQAKALDKALEMSERAVNLAAQSEPPRKRGFFRRLFGI